jgi:hypothetical protein
MIFSTNVTFSKFHDFFVLVRPSPDADKGGHQQVDIGDVHHVDLARLRWLGNLRVRHIGLRLIGVFLLLRIVGLLDRLGRGSRLVGVGMAASVAAGRIDEVPGKPGNRSS